MSTSGTPDTPRPPTETDGSTVITIESPLNTVGSDDAPSCVDGACAL